MDSTPTVKSEIGGARSKRLMSTAVEAVDNVSLANKCLKRRRRSPSIVGLNCMTDQAGLLIQQQQPSPTSTLAAPLQLDPTTTTATTPTTTTTVKRSSRFRGVSRHRWTGRYEAHLWDKGSWNATQRKKGKQVYLGAYDEEESAARAYDLAAIKYWGTSTFTNFPVSDYEKEVEIMENVTKEEYLASLRRRSSGFSRGVSKYRGVARHHHNGRWEARIGRVFGNKYLYLGTYSTQEEAAHAYDIAAIEYRGINAVTNFDLSTYIRWLGSGANNNNNNNPLAITNQDPMLSTSPHQPLQAVSHPINPMNDEPADQFTFNSHAFTMGKPELLERKMPISTNPSSSSSSSASPTALGLLLRSSMFKALVEKNSNAADEETDQENEEMKGNGGGDNVFGGFFNFNGISNELPSLESKEEDASTSMFSPNRQRQSLWNGSLNMPTMR